MSSAEIQDKIIALIKDQVSWELLREVMICLGALDNATRKEMMAYVRKHEQ